MSEIEKTTSAEGHFDHDGPDVWVDRYGDAMFAFAYARTEDRAVAEDLVQETFLSAIAAQEEFRGGSRVSTWLFAILKRKVADHFRKADRRRRLDQETEKLAPRGQSEAANDPSRLFQSREFWETFDSCVEKLPDRLAEVFMLREVNQLPPKEIRELLGINATNLSMRLHRCRLALRECLDRHWFEGQ